MTMVEIAGPMKHKRNEGALPSLLAGVLNEAAPSSPPGVVVFLEPGLPVVSPLTTRPWWRSALTSRMRVPGFHDPTMGGLRWQRVPYQTS